MHQSLKSFIPFEREFVNIQLFGYATKGLPGVDIVAPGRSLRSMKEKLIYLTRIQGLKLPKRRYVLCIEVEDEAKKLREDDMRWLELPLLLLYWTLAGIVPIHQLQNCFCAGKICLDGRLGRQRFPPELIESLSQKDKRPLFIVHQQHNLPDDFEVIELEHLLEGKLEFKSRAP